MDLVSVRTANSLTRLLLRGKVSRSPLKCLLINWGKAVEKANKPCLWLEQKLS